MVALSSVANVINYTSGLAFSRLLAPVGFGELTSLLALLIVLAVPLGAAQTAVAQRVAIAHAAGDTQRLRYLVRYALGHVMTLAIAGGLIYIACIPLVISGLHIRQPGPAIALAPLIIVTFLNPVIVGVLQGMERFAAMGLVIFATAASRLLFGVPWAMAGGGPGGAIAGQAIGLGVVSVAVLYRYRSWIMPRGTGVARQGMRRRFDVFALSATGAFVGFALLSNVDLVLARIYLNEHDAGIYAAIATVAKVLIFLPSAMAALMVPSAARHHAATGSGLHILRRSAAAILIADVLFAIPALVAPHAIVHLMFGPKYGGAARGVVPAVISGSGLALLYLLATYSVTVRDRRWVFLLAGGVALQVGAIAAVHHSTTQIAWVQACVVVAILLMNELLFRSVVRGRAP